MSKKDKLTNNVSLGLDFSLVVAPSVREVNFFVRLFLSLVMLVSSIVLTKIIFFKDIPWLGVGLLVQLPLSILFSLFGFFTLPLWFVRIKRWLQIMIVVTVNQIVAAFWDTQSKKIQEARREKQKAKAKKGAESGAVEIGQGVLLDTSVLVDGRILDIVKIGFFDKTLIVPQFVLEELHLLADSKEGQKRQRGRRGLDIVRDLRKITKVMVPENKLHGDRADKLLVKFARDYKCKFMTLDFNLSKLADISGIKTLNINDLSAALKAVYLPGEEIKIKVTHAGKEKEQGIGYLPDGTMIVIENSKDRVGQEISAKVTKIIQTSAGKIIFAEVSSMTDVSIG